jgi:heterodisulfide reductase subunit B
LIAEREGRNFKAIHLNIAQFIALAMGGDFDKVIGVKAHTVPIDSIIRDLKEVEK